MDLRAMADALPVLISYVDEQGRYQFVNAAYERWFRVRREDIEGRHVRDVVGDEAWAAIEHHVRAALAGEHVRFENLVPYRGAGSRWVQVDYVPERSPAGEVTGFYALVQDVSERRQLEDELRQAQKLEAIGRLASSIAHDFRNLLMGISGVADMADQTLEAGHPVHDLLEEIRVAARGGSDVVRRLLTFARGDETQPVHVEVDRTIRDQANMLRSLLGGGVELRLELGAPGRFTRCGSGRLEQVLLNLAANAGYAMPEGGTLTIATAEEGERVRVRVHDTGHGMDAVTLERALEPFFTTRAAGEGSGLGLSAVYGIVRKCGGELRIASAPARGTTVEVLLPVVEPAATEAEGEPASEPPAPRTVLVVEDERLIRMATSHYLKRHGFEVIEAEDAEQALDALARRGRVDLLITDITLPRVSGPELASRVVSVAPATPVLFVSALPRELLVEQGRIASGAASLEKPFDEAALLAAVERCLAA